MESGSWILERLGRWGKPPPLRSLLSNYFRGFDVGFILLPFAATALRLWTTAPSRPIDTFLILLAATLAMPLLFAVIVLPVRKGNAIAAARGVDQAVGGSERFLTAADCLTRGIRSSLLPLLLRDVAQELKRLGRVSVVPVRLNPPAFLRAFLACLLGLLILFVPAFDTNAFGPDRFESEAADSSDLAGGAAADAGTGLASDFSGKVEVRVTTDRAVYVLGEEIFLKVKLKTLEPLPDGVALGAMVKVDGEKFVSLPLEWTLPADPGVELVAEFQMKSRLEAVERYRRGLLALDTFVFPKEDRDGLEGSAPGNRVVIQISENAEKLRKEMPTPVKKDKKKKKPKKQKQPPKPEKNPNQKEPKKRPAPRPQAGPVPKPPEEIKNNPFVIEPLFSGDDELERDVRIYDRDPEDSDRPPPSRTRAKEPVRSYQRGTEADIRKLKLPGRERRLVRRYVEGLRRKK